VDYKAVSLLFSEFPMEGLICGSFKGKSGKLALDLISHLTLFLIFGRFADIAIRYGGGGPVFVFAPETLGKQSSFHSANESLGFFGFPSI